MNSMSSNHFLHFAALWGISLAYGRIPTLEGSHFHLNVWNIVINSISSSYSLCRLTLLGLKGLKQGMSGSIHLVGVGRELGFALAFGVSAAVICFIVCYCCPLPAACYLLLID